MSSPCDSSAAVVVPSDDANGNNVINKPNVKTEKADEGEGGEENVQMKGSSNSKKTDPVKA